MSTGSATVVVLGRGIQGLTTAFHFLRSGWQSVEVWGPTEDRHTGPWTAQWELPAYLAEPYSRMVQWGIETSKDYDTLLRTGNQTGITYPVRNYILSRSALKPNPFSAELARYRHTIDCLSEPAIAKMFAGRHPGGTPCGSGVYVDAQAYDTYVINVREHITWLYGKIAALGGRVVNKSVHGIADARTNSLGTSSTVIVNATGRNAAQVARDPKVFGVSGQVMRVRFPQCRVCVEDHDTGGYCIPYFDKCDGGVDETARDSTLLQLGGSADDVVLDRNGDPVNLITPTLGTARKIFDKCHEMLPGVSSIGNSERLAQSFAASARSTVDLLASPSDEHSHAHPAGARGTTTVLRGKSLGPSDDRIEHYIGIRPGRAGGARVTVDVETLDERRMVVAHNYGHGGAGIMTAFGCAREVEAKCYELVCHLQDRGNDCAKL
eukprot:m.291959 g.291959  ORF g.291959 m.291959 type:complete len:436 (+) comp19989_c0_seq2:129-1436(+)